MQYALEHGMIDLSYVQEQMAMNKRRELLDPTISEVFDEWNDRRLPICGGFCVYGEIFIAKEKDTPVGIFSEFNFQF